MPLLFGTREWAEALEAEINASSEYRNAAGNWGVGFNGILLLAFEADAVMPRGFALLLKLRGGACQGASFVADLHSPEAGFALRAPFTLWKDILRRRRRWNLTHGCQACSCSRALKGKLSMVQFAVELRTNARTRGG